MNTTVHAQMKSTRAALQDDFVRTLQGLTDSELQEIAAYLAFIRYRGRMQALPQVDTAQLASLYAEFAEEDRELAEEGMTEYLQKLQSEEA